MDETKISGEPCSLWVMSLTEGDDDPEVEAADAGIHVERTDEDEVAIHGLLAGEDQAIVSLYVTRAQAALVAAQLVHVAVPSEFSVERVS